ncbi:MAG: hypothetical protein COY80_01185 [Candidatus Pacebacteria bacterium CG_4_10_14_0_8_um_filter_42_14]|nr:MAG: hypothetical protein COY80_01185 [Candidatus Pacebacteria bacterium CG_4_10_14_0_8_um_filter_42_14]
MTKPFDALALGSIYLDIHYGEFPFDPEIGIRSETETVGNEVQLRVGGSAANFAQVGSGLGLKTALVAKIGQDRVGNIVTDILNEQNILRLIFTDPEVKTNVSSHFTNPQGDTIQTTAGTANLALDGEDAMRVVRNYFDKISALYIGSYFKLTMLQDKYEAIVKSAREHDVLTLLDHGMISNVVNTGHIEQVKSLVRNVDVYIPNEQEFLTIWNVNSIKQGFEKMLSLPKRPIIVVTRGANGAIGLDQDGSIHDIPSFKVQPKNAVGAGDSFNAGFLKAWQKKFSMDEAIRYAHAVAAIRISENTPPSKESVQALLDK